MDAEAPPGARVGEAARAEAAAGMVAPTAAQEAEEEAPEVVATLDAEEPPARGVRARADTVTPRAETIGSTHAAPTEQAASAPRRTADRAPTSLL